MTDRIDLDSVEIEDDEPDANYGDWFWRGEGDPDDEPDSAWGDGSASAEPTLGGESRESDPAEAERGSTVGESDPSEDRNAFEASGGSEEAGGSEERSRSEHSSASGGSGDAPDDPSPDRQAAPGIPNTSGGPVGVPKDRGGAGGASSSGTGGGFEPMGAAPHDEDVDDMTMALTYDAIRRVEDPQFVIASAREWADWIGIVGNVETPAIQKFQRDTGIDVDFFGGSATGPGERLADIDRRSMFYAERMVVVGPETDEWIAEVADWEFVPLEVAAEKAGWELE